MKPININVVHGVAVPGQPVTLGVPLARGEVTEVTHLRLVDQAGTPLPCDVIEQQRWPDSSLKWVLLHFTLNHNFERASLVLADANSVREASAFTVVDTESAFVFELDDLRFEIDRSSGRTLPRVSKRGELLWHADGPGVVLGDAAGAKVPLTVKSVEQVAVATQFVEWRVDGHFRSEAGVQVGVSLHYKLWASAMLIMRCSLHNAQRAAHEGGLWDLGDAGSFNFSEFKVRIEHPDGQASVRTMAGSPWHDTPQNSAALVRQSTSGGEHWNSPVHLCADGELPATMATHHNGYQLMFADELIEQGARSTPVVNFTTSGGAQYQSSIKHFWQNFPSSCGCDAAALEWQLFPDGGEDQHELQGGERKSHEIVFSFNDDRASLDWLEQGAIISVSPDVYQHSGVLRNFETGYRTGEYEELLQAGLSDTRGYLAKREAVDEYGWRHFGEIYADHETAFHSGDEIFVSHYNNQYDPIYGFARQWVTSADVRWSELMHPLARHVLDIDIYRTSSDRAEYNNGLFWHTDHYKPAHTCTHRTFSIHQYPADWSGHKGGGPGPEHCYTTGLKLYFLLTGDRDARDTLLGMAEWISAYYEGTGTLIEQCKRAGTDIKTLLSILRGHKVLRYEYPFNRGIGNYIRALLDSAELTGDDAYLHRAERIIGNTFGPADDIATRDLHDVEHTWFYTVFLQEVIYYLHVKRERGELDDRFDYARQSLLHYADWMAQHEQPSLEAAELEYPNDTWVAQDIRKVEIFFAAYCLATVNRERYLERARYFRDYVLSTLQASDTAHYARIQIILLQNHGASGLLHQQVASGNFNDEPVQDNCYQSVWPFLRQLAGRWASALLRINPAREIRWVKTRIS